MLNHVAPYRYLLPNLYLSVADIANQDLFACGSPTWIILDIARFCGEHCQTSSGSTWPACPKKAYSGPYCWDGRVATTILRFCQTAVTATPRATPLCRLEPCQGIRLYGWGVFERTVAQASKWGRNPIGENK